MSKVWLITGCSRGLGRELAKAVLAAGHQLVATARKTADLQELVAQYGDRVRAVALNVTDEAAARAAVARFRRLDVVVNNAGYATVSSIEELLADDFRAQKLVHARFPRPGRHDAEPLARVRAAALSTAASLQSAVTSGPPPACRR